MAPGIARALTWPEVDSYYVGYGLRQQKALAGHRLVALQIYNALAEKPLKAYQYLPLPGVDGNTKAVAAPAPTEDFLERMAKRIGRSIVLETAITD